MPSVLVTGAGRGIGRAITTRLAGAGWSVLAGVRDDAGRRALAEADTGGRITPVRLDVTDEADIAALPDRLPERLDAVVNNAGIGILGPVEAVPLPDWRRQFEVNVFGQVAVTQAVLPRLRASRGRVVFITSSGGRVAVPLEGAYCASKFAVEGLADAMRAELRPWGVHVSVVEPGPTDTGPWREITSMVDEMEARMTPAHRDLYRRHVDGLRRLVGRLQSRTAPPDDVAKVVERALTAPRPRARYLVGTDAHAMVAMQAALPTRWYDAIGARIGGLE